MPANETTNRAQGALLQHPGHRALRKGRVSIANSVYLVTATTIDRHKLFANFGAGCAAAQCFEDTRLLGDAKMLACWRGC